MKVFVYGTLLTNFHNWRLYVQPMLGTGQATLLGPAMTVDSFPMIVTAERNVPAIYNAKGDGCTRIRGEVYDMTESCVDALDIIEGTKDGFYTRLPLKTRVGNSEEILECDSYFKGSGKILDLDNLDNNMEETRQLMEWKESGKPLLDGYTKELHESYYVKCFHPEVLALASSRSIEDVNAAYKQVEDKISACKTEREKTEVLATVWEKLM